MSRTSLISSRRRRAACRRPAHDTRLLLIPFPDGRVSKPSRRPSQGVPQRPALPLGPLPTGQWAPAALRRVRSPVLRHSARKRASAALRRVRFPALLHLAWKRASAALRRVRSPALRHSARKRVPAALRRVRFPALHHPARKRAPAALRRECSPTSRPGPQRECWQPSSSPHPCLAPSGPPSRRPRVELPSPTANPLPPSKAMPLTNPSPEHLKNPFPTLAGVIQSN